MLTLNYTDIAKELIEAKADLNTATSEGCVPLC